MVYEREGAQHVPSKVRSMTCDSPVSSGIFHGPYKQGTDLLLYTGPVVQTSNSSPIETLELACLLHDKYRRFGDPRIIIKQIKTCCEGIELAQSRQRSILTCLLAAALRDRFQHFREPSDLSNSIHNHTAALRSTDITNADRAWMLCEACHSHLIHYRLYIQRDALTNAVSLAEEALRLRPTGNLLRFQSLLITAIALRSRYAVMGKSEDIAVSHSLSEEALELCHSEHPARPLALHNLACSLRLLYNESRMDHQLSAAISLHREALQLGGPCHSMRPVFLMYLATSLREQAYDSKLPHLVDEAVALARMAAAVWLNGHRPHHYSADNLVLAPRDRYKLYGCVRHLDENISIQRNALHATLLNPQTAQADLPTVLPCTVPEHDTIYHGANVGTDTLVHDMPSEASFVIVSGQAAQLPLLRRRALSLVSKAHSEGGPCLFGMARLYLSVTKGIEGVATALRILAQSLVDPCRSSQLRLSDAFDVLEKVENRMNGLTWSKDARRFAVAAYRKALNLLPRISVFGAPPQLRLHLLATIGPLIQHAAMHALQLDDVKEAVELLERGKATFWSYLLRLRTPVDALPPSLSSEIRDVAMRLETMSTIPQFSVRGVMFGLSIRELDERLEALLQEARRVSGISRFMLHESYEPLSIASECGPVVILLPGPTGSHAIILKGPLEVPIHLNLPITSSILSNLLRRIHHSGIHRDVTNERLRHARVRRFTGDDAEHALGILWKCIVLLVINSLGWTVRLL